MSTSCRKTKSESSAANLNSRTDIVPEFEAKNLGAPFKILLHNAVSQTCDKKGRVLSTSIPNLRDLRREIALARCLHPRKLSPIELKFLRKAIGSKAVEIANLLGISPEHLSRCEKGDRVLSTSAEKLFRVAVLNKRHDMIDLADKLISTTDGHEISPDSIRELKDVIAGAREMQSFIETAIFDTPIQSAHDSESKLVFAFWLRDSSRKTYSSKSLSEEGKWKLASNN